jgi:hypothetical protein
VVVDHLSGIVVGQRLESIVTDGLAESERTYSGQRIWTLAEVYFPVGPGDGYIPSAWAYGSNPRARFGGRVRGFGAWIGAAGD